jgi:hypothetical protein
MTSRQIWSIVIQTFLSNFGILAFLLLKGEPIYLILLITWALRANYVRSHLIYQLGLQPEQYLWQWHLLGLMPACLGVLCSAVLALQNFSLPLMNLFELLFIGSSWLVNLRAISIYQSVYGRKRKERGSYGKSDLAIDRALARGERVWLNDDGEVTLVRPQGRVGRKLG